MTAWLPLVLVLAAPTAPDCLRNRIEAGTADAQGSVRALGSPVHARLGVPAFYEARGYEPAWTVEQGRVLETAVAAVKEDGLHPADYHVDALDPRLLQDRRWPRRRDPCSRADADILHTDAFLTLADHLLKGRLHPETLEPDWVVTRRDRDLVALLEESLKADDPDAIADALDGLRPAAPGYATLRARLGHYRQVLADGGWAPQDGSEERLRARLQADTARIPGDTAEAVASFQGRHGLPPTGTVDDATRAQLDVPVEARILQLEINLERFRWLPQTLGDPHVLVNIAAFELEVVRAGRVEMEMPVIVGKPFRKTPVFSDRITHIVLSPYWHVPYSIATQDIVPVVRKNPGYLREKKMVVFSATTGREVSPASVDWKTLGPGNFPYRLRQDPGPLNALGPVKIMFPNKFSVYLHGTPAQELFASAVRTFSSGCIRLERPLDLAAVLVGDQANWDRRSIDTAAKAGVERTVKLSTPVAIHLLYWTAWADSGGAVHFRPDVYTRDDAVARGLAAQRGGR